MRYVVVVSGRTQEAVLHSAEEGSFFKRRSIRELARFDSP
jgi:hypothetical protein